MNRWTITRTTIYVAQAALVIGALWMPSSSAWSQSKPDGRADKMFHASATDVKGIETDLKNVIFYWEEKISETAFVPHELKEVPVKRGTATVKIKFDSIKLIDLKPSGNGSLPNVSITLADGKTGDFVLAIAGSFKGQSDFGEVELAASELKKLAFK
ncbi:MAG TPA: hypothetical protein PLO50_08170 [Nitrospira sp.]|nr:hypothetical protein [Nitrospira sp.]